MSRIDVTVSSPPRGARASATVRFPGQSWQFTHAWGSSPGQGVLDYISQGPGVEVGGMIRVLAAGGTVMGIVKSDILKTGSDGRVRSIEMVDVREYLAWDWVLCAFNQPQDVMVDGLLQRRYWHLPPAQFISGERIFTAQPMSAREILEEILGFTKRNHPRDYTIETAWDAEYHPDQNDPVLDIDFSTGRTLAAALTEISEKQGLVFGLNGTERNPYRLKWVKMGEGALPQFADGRGGTTPFPPNSDQRRGGLVFSGQPTRVRVIGDRNLYQVRDIPMQPDWVRAWEGFLDVWAFEDDLFRRGSDVDGTRFNQIPGDVDGLIGRARAAASAREITVRQYAQLRARVRLPGESLREPREWLDWRKYAGRLRADMPAELYLASVVFRAFRPRQFKFQNSNGCWVACADNLEAVPRLLAPVSHDPQSGLMNSEPGVPGDGNGYAIARGYQVGADMFASLRPERFQIQDWLARQLVWQSIPFHLDDSGEGGVFILFEQPVVSSSNLFVASDQTDGWPVIRADFTLEIPEVRACLTFAAERFQWLAGTGHRDAVENVPGLNGQFLVAAEDPASAQEIAYADGQGSANKARAIAQAALNRPFTWAEGGYMVRGANATKLTSTIDRVTVSVSPQGTTEVVDFTAARRTDAFQPERRLDRLTREMALIPGQEEWLKEARQLRLLAAGLRGNAAFTRQLVQVLSGASQCVLFPQSTQAPATTTLRAGTPVWKASATGPAQLHPGQEHAVFAGLVARHGDRIDRPVPVHTTGEVLAQVRGPAAINDVVGKADGDFLAVNAAVPVGRVLAAGPDAQTKLVPIRLGAGGGGTNPSATHPWKIVETGNDQVLVGPGFVTRGLSVCDLVEVIGCSTPFTVSPGDLIWLELWFDFTSPANTGGYCYFACIAHGPTWAGYPTTVQVVEKRGQTPESTIPDRSLMEAIAQQQWVGLSSSQRGPVLDGVMERLNKFPSIPASLRRQMRAFVLIGFSTPSPDASGVRVAGFTLVQCLKENLALTWMTTDYQVWCQSPIPAPQPLIQLPAVLASVQADKVTLSCPGFSRATIFYRQSPADAATAFTLYSEPFARDPATVLQAYASLPGYVSSPVLMLPLVLALALAP